jgi:TolB-like protein/DNA-binding winged helix-turn-helix (wHTH) protein/Tfp pilus assembly protein PilF
VGHIIVPRFHQLHHLLIFRNFTGRLAAGASESLSENAKDSSHFFRNSAILIMDPTEKHIFKIGALRLDPSEHVLVRDGRIVPLTPKAFEILLILAENVGHVVDKDELLRRVWPDTFVEEANLAKNVSMLRKVLSQNGMAESSIETIPKRGYRLVAELNGNHTSSKTDAYLAVERAPTLEIAPSRENWRKKRRPMIAAVAGLVLVALLIFAFALQRANDAATKVPIRSLAVLPFENLSGDPAQEYFSDGMTETLITELGKVQNLLVVSRKATIRYKGTEKNISEIARELNVDAVVTGSATQLDGHVRITLQLYRAVNGQSIWSENYERTSGNAVALQGQIARAIADKIKIKLSPQEQAKLRDDPPVNPAAEAAYLKGLYLETAARNASRSEEAGPLRLKSIAEFEKALEIEPTYSKAYGERAMVYVVMAIASAEYFPNAKECAIAALKLDDSNAKAHAALAVILWRHEWDPVGAEKEFERSNELDPSAELRENSGWALFLSATGRNEEAIREIKRTEEISPFDNQAKFQVGNNLLRAKQYDLAIEKFREVLDLDPKKVYARFALSNALVYKGDFAEAIAQTQKGIDSGDSSYAVVLAWIYARSGQIGEARRILADVEKTPFGGHDQYTGGLGIARVYAALGDKERAIYWLEKDFAAHTPWLIWLGADEAFQGMRGDPRFQEMLKRLGLSPPPVSQG